MKSISTRIPTLVLAGLLGVLSAHGQANPPQVGTEQVNNTTGYLNSMQVFSVTLTDFEPGFNTELAQSGCDNTFLYSTLFANGYTGNDPDSWVYWNTPSTDDPVNWASLPTSDGTVAFTLEINYRVYANTNVVRAQPLEWQVFIDDVECVDCAVVLSTTNMWCNATSVQHVRIEHDLGDAWASPADGKQKYTLRPVMRPLFQTEDGLGDAYNCTTYCSCVVLGICTCYPEVGWEDHSASVVAGQVPEIRFMAVMVGTIFSDVLGEFDTPQVPLTILRRPPGDLSMAFWNEETQQCFGSSMFVNTGTGSDTWARARYGAAGSLELVPGLSTDFEVYAEGSASISTDYDAAGTVEWKTCVTNGSEYETQTGGSPEDYFIGSSLRYAYGYATSILREEGSCAVLKDAGFLMVPIATNSTYIESETDIRDEIVPGLEAEIAVTPPGDQLDSLMMQLDVWQQALDMNDSIKANALQAAVPATFDGADLVETAWMDVTTSETRTIDWSFTTESEIGLEVGEFFGGSGAAVGASIQLRTAFGRGEEQSSVYSNHVGYKLGDDDPDDRFKVLIKEDPVFGTYVFGLHPDSYTRSSCPYEGGFQLDQPQLYVQADGQTTMVLNDVPIGTPAVFPLLICNDSFFERTYHLKYNANTNTEGALLQVFGNPLTNDEGVELVVPSSGCLAVSNLLLNEPASPIGPDYEIDLYLYSLCEPAIRSTITVEAHFDLSTSIEDAGNSSDDWFTVRPNPSNGQFQLLPTNLSAPLSVMVTDATGRTVKAPFIVAGSGMVTLDMGDVAPGMYHLIASSAGEQRSVKLMVQH